jgi:hypothetical protein
METIIISIGWEKEDKQSILWIVEIITINTTCIRRSKYVRLIIGRFQGWSKQEILGIFYSNSLESWLWRKEINSKRRCIINYEQAEWEKCSLGKSLVGSSCLNPEGSLRNEKNSQMIRELIDSYNYF